ncbi:ABC transporter ATP-binding protein [Paractinoplanes rishiriensis]|uniref:ABC transporter permease n=1 Tax=Paractinoplanes rishiriensis TaxID=1050105 RepID=A0A919MZ48_9ACTN|nr:ABC transporter ATP-binding protein [Actinoplanes rishiriensis]GIF01034.1 ABC transporter permease [Actinoplanes rishiriensis]
MTTYLRLWTEMFRLCWRKRPGMTALVLLLQLVNTAAFAVVGLALKALVDEMSSGGGVDVAALTVAAFGAALAFALDWTIGELAAVLTVHLVDSVGLTGVEPEILGICAGLDGIDHLERAEFLDRVTAVRGQGWAVVESAWSVLLSVLVVVRLLVTVAVLASAAVWLLLLVPGAAVQLWLDARGKRRVIATEVAVAGDVRLQRALFRLLTEPASVKEIQVAGVGDELRARQRAVWDGIVRARTSAWMTAGIWSSAGWLLFAVSYTVGLGLTVARGGSAGAVVLAVTLGAQLRTVLESALRSSTAAAESRRVLEPFRWLRRYAAEQRRRHGSGQAPPEKLRDGITLDRVSFRYHGGVAPAVHEVSVTLPAGSVVAVVGEYGSGKTTLVKLLAKMYEPTSGAIRVDGADLGDLDTAQWRLAMSAAFQDFGRYETTLAEAVGLGDITAPETARQAAIEAADANGLVDQLPDGPGTLLGTRFGGRGLSEGQWQKVALARACMRTSPLLFVLDEPTASLDAPSEHLIFQRYMRRAGEIAATSGGITLIVSHRFSTVADADLILVLEDGRLIESGSHQELLEHGGTYADLYGLQATAYALGNEGTLPAM